MSDEAELRVRNALLFARTSSQFDGAHHKAWAIDQMVRFLTGCPVVEKSAVDCNNTPYTYNAQGESDEYKKLVADAKAGEDGPDTYEWNVGIPP